MNAAVPSKRPSSFRRFFSRGLAIVLPTAVTIWILWAAYNFVDDHIASPINQGVKQTILAVVPFEPFSAERLREVEQGLGDEERAALRQAENKEAFRRRKAFENLRLDLTAAERAALSNAKDPSAWLRRKARKARLEAWWSWPSIGGFELTNLIGLFIALVLIYFVGLFVGSYLGHGAVRRGEALLQRLPLVRHIYPYVKQVTDYLVGGVGDRKLQFHRVVAAEYPRKDMWSLGLVTGETIPAIEDRAGRTCLTVFIPTSPTPFTGYVITVPEEDTIPLAMSIEEGLRFTLSGGVILPPSEARTPPEPRSDANRR